MKFLDYLSFTGRVNRGEFWKFIFCVQVPMQVVIGGIMIYLIRKYGGCRLRFSEMIYYDVLCFWACFFALCFTSLLAAGVSVRRLHDLNLSGWWLLLFLWLNSISTLRIPTLLVFLLLTGCVRGSKSVNRFGIA